MKVGDLIRVRKDCTIEELMENKWNKARKDTTEFLKHADLEDTYEINDISSRGNIIIEGVTENDLYVNPNLFEVIASNGKEKDINAMLDRVRDILINIIETIEDED